MKKLFLGLSTLVLILIGFVACTAALKVPIIGNKPATLKPGHVLVQVAFDDFPSYPRTVVPQEWDDAKKEALRYTLRKATVNGDVIGMANLEWKAIKKGYYVDLPDGSNTIWLVATTPAPDNKIALVATTTITVPGSDQLSFVLRPYRDTQTEAADAAKGEIDLTFAFLDPILPGKKNVDTVKATLDLATGSTGTLPANKVQSFDASKIQKAYGGSTDQNNMSSIHYTENVQAGVYTLLLKLYNDTALWATASTTIVVDPANKSTDTIQISYKLDTKPPKPTQLQVRYARPEDTSGEYAATFTWVDNSYNEDGFELIIQDESGATLNPQPTINPSPIPANATSAKVTLELGKKYKAKIRAKNARYGDSDFTDFKDTNTGNIIHLARIKYDLMEEGHVHDVPESENPLCVKSIAPSTTTPPHNLAIGYYSSVVTGANVQLPGVISFPFVYRSVNNKVYTLKGWTGVSPTNPNITIGSATTPVFELPDNTSDNLSLTAVWEERNTISTEFPQYTDTCYIERANQWISANVNVSQKINVKIIPQEGYSFEGVVETKCPSETGTVMTPAATPSTTSGVLTLAIDITFKSKGEKFFYILIKLKNATTGHEKFVSAGAYFEVK